LKSSGKFFDAEPLAREYLEISKRLHGEEHPDVGVALANLASIYEDMENTDEALKYYDQCLELRQRLFQGRDHPDTAKCLQKIAILKHKLGQYKQVLIYFERSLEMNKKCMVRITYRSLQILTF